MLLCRKNAKQLAINATSIEVVKNSNKILENFNHVQNFVAILATSMLVALVGVGDYVAFSL